VGNYLGRPSEIGIMGQRAAYRRSVLPFTANPCCWEVATSPGTLHSLIEVGSWTEFWLMEYRQKLYSSLQTWPRKIFSFDFRDLTFSFLLIFPLQMISLSFSLSI